MKKPANLWPLGITTAFGVFIFSTIGLIIMACSEKTDLVNDHYYEQELRYQAQIDSAMRTHRLEGEASISFDAAGRNLAIAIPASQVRAGVQGRIEMYRPSSADCDRRLLLAPAANGTQRVELPDLLPGLWKVRVCWSSGGLDYTLEQKITNSAAAEFPGHGT